MKNITATISKGGKIIYEESVILHSSVKIEGNVFMGAYSYMGQGGSLGTCRVGRFCSIGHNVIISPGVHDVNYASTHPFFFGSKNSFNIPDGIGIPRDFNKQMYTPPNIGNDVWIGSNAMIMRGVNVGDGAVIAAGAIVSKNVAPYEIVGGVPARVIKKRFSDELIEQFLRIKWWNFDVENFIGIDSSNPESFIKHASTLDDSKKACYQRIVKTCD